MKEEKEVYIKRRGAKWEGIGFLLIIVSIIIAIASGGSQGGMMAGSLMGFTGFIVFIIGRFK